MLSKLQSAQPDVVSQNPDFTKGGSCTESKSTYSSNIACSDLRRTQGDTASSKKHVSVLEFSDVNGLIDNESEVWS